MQIKPFAVAAAIAAAVSSPLAIADHNSKFGEGWALMPNDVHNTRVETRLSGDNDAFRNFVRYGNGAESVNRFSTNESFGARPGAAAMARNGSGGRGGRR